jgi:hypothetical protein
MRALADGGSSMRVLCALECSGAPDRIRTCGLRLRRPTLYPAELRARRRAVPDEKNSLTDQVTVVLRKGSRRWFFTAVRRWFFTTVRFFTTVPGADV